MSFNLSKKMLDVMKVTATMDVENMTKVQQTKFAKYLRTGVTKGNGVPAVAAHRYMKDNNLPHLHMPYGGYVDLRFTPVGHPLRELLKQAIVMSKIEIERDYDIEGHMEVVNTPADGGDAWWRTRVHIHENTTPVLYKHDCNYEVPSTITFSIELDDEYPHESL